MKLRFNRIVALLILVAMCLYGWTALGQRQGVVSPQWEYTTKLAPGAPEDSPTIFAELGSQGWELIAVADGRTYFKRQKK